MIILIAIKLIYSNIYQFMSTLKYFYRYGIIAKQIRSEQEFKQCIFNNDLLSLKTSQPQISVYPWYNKYAPLFSLSQANIQINSAIINKFVQSYPDIEGISISLQLISVLTHKIRQNIIHPQCYFDLLSKYYSYFRADMNKQAHIRMSQNIVINPKLSLQNVLIKSFIGRNDYNMLALIKKTQIQLLQMISKLKDIDKDTFITLVNPNVFNISDLSSVQMHFFNQLFPTITKLQSIDEAERILIYLTNFSIMPLIFPKILLFQLKSYMNSHQTLNLKNILQIGNCLYLMIYKFNKILKQSGELANYDLFVLQLQQKVIACEDNQEQIGKFIKNNRLIQKMIYITKKIELQRLLAIKNNYQQQLQKINLSKQYSLDQCLISERDKINNQSFTQTASQKIEKHIRIKFTRLIMVFSYLCGPEMVNTFYRYLQNEETYIFLKQNIYTPDLIKSIQLTFEHINALPLQFNTKHLDSSIKSYFDQFRDKVSYYLNEQIIIQNENINNSNNQNVHIQSLLYEIKHQQMLYKASTPSQDIQDILYYNHSFDQNKLNLLRLLKNDQGFIASLIKWNYNRYISMVYLKQFNYIKQYLNYWQYPHYYAFKVQNYQKQILKIFVKNMYNKNQLIPPQQNNHIYINESGNLLGITRSLNKLL